MFEVAEGAQGSITSGRSFDPTHQDGVEALAVHGDVCYSGSRDCCIKKWDLGSTKMLQVPEHVFTRIHYQISGWNPSDEVFCRSAVVSPVRQRSAGLGQRSGPGAGPPGAAQRMQGRVAAALARRLSSAPRRAPGARQSHQRPGYEQQPTVHRLRVSHSLEQM